MGQHLRKKISWHLKDLLGRDLRVIDDVVEWAAPAPGDIERRAYPKRLAARWCAAKMIKAAVQEGNAGLFTHILDRTEGKVADRLELDHKKTVNIRIELASGSRQSDVIEGEEVRSLPSHGQEVDSLHNSSYQTCDSLTLAAGLGVAPSPGPMLLGPIGVDEAQAEAHSSIVPQK